MTQPFGPCSSGQQQAGRGVVGEDIEPGTYKSSGAAIETIECCSVTTPAGETQGSRIIDC